MRTRAAGFIMAVLAAGFLAGCGKDSDRPEYAQLEGRVKSIDLESGVVEMWWFSPKQKKEIPLKGTLDANAEILIDGRTAELSELREDDWVSVKGRGEGHGEERQLIATSVEVKREQRATITPATQPAEGERDQPPSQQ